MLDRFGVTGGATAGLLQNNRAHTASGHIQLGKNEEETHLMSIDVKAAHQAFPLLFH